MSGLGNIASARGIQLDEVTATVEGDIDLRGILDIDQGVRNGFEGIQVVFHVKRAAHAEKLAALVRQSQALAPRSTTSYRVAFRSSSTSPLADRQPTARSGCPAVSSGCGTGRRDRTLQRPLDGLEARR